MHKRFLLLILVISFFKEITWISLIPIWHFPDEQSHFGQVAYLAEKGNKPPYDENNLTEEIRKSEELLGTERDELGVNKFTYHPDYRIEYTNTIEGKYENSIKDLAQNPNARKMVKQESSHYPSFYYAILAFFYRRLYHNDIFARVFVSRIFQSIFALGTVYLSVQIGKILFPKNNLLPVTVGILVSFHPMFSFVSAGINSDNIGNFIFTLYILASLKILRDKFNTTRLFIIIAITFFAVYFKPQFIIVIPLTFILITIGLFDAKVFSGGKLKFLIVLLLWLDLFIDMNILTKFKIGTTYVVYQQLTNKLNLTSFLIYLKTYALPQLYREVLPWYWGIYDWLGVTYLRIVHRLINWIAVVAIAGFSLWFLKFLRQRKWPIYGIIFALLTNIILFLGIYGFDWLQIVISNIHLGVQGRYFFPAIATHMIFLIMGISYLVPEKLKYVGMKLMGILMIIFNFYALYTVSKTYYDLYPPLTFLNQVSQYKPWFFKQWWLVSVWLTYLIIVFLFLIEYIRYPHERKNT